MQPIDPVTCAFVTVGVGNKYPMAVERMRSSLKRVRSKATLLSWVDEYPPASPTHQAVPYAFKIHALEESVRRGFHRVIWLDSSFFAVRNPDDMFRWVDRLGAIGWHCGFTVAQWCHDTGLRALGLTRDAAATVPLIAGGCVGLNVHSAIGARVLKQWGEYSRDGISFPGPWTNDNGSCSADKRCRGHRHDMPSLSLVMQGAGATVLPFGIGWDYAGPNACETSFFLVQGM